MRAASALLSLLLVLLATVAGCGAGEGAAAAPSSGGPVAFADESFAELATDGNDALWLAVAGYRRNGDFGLRVFRESGLGWSRLPSPPGPVSGDLPISIAVADIAGPAAPCIGYSRGSGVRPTVACFTEGAWQSLALPSLAGEQLLQIGADGGKLRALLVTQRGSLARYRVVSNAAGNWSSTPTIAAAPAVARLTIEDPESPTADSPSIGFATQGRFSRHFVMELQNGRWKRLQPTVRKAGTGPLIGGPVLLAGRIFYPVNEADREPWSFSVQSARLGANQPRVEPLSTGTGSAQGRLDLVTGRVWATWQEDHPLKDGRFRARIYAAELSHNGKLERRRRLWRGISIGPGSTQVVGYRGRLISLYMRSSSNGRGLQVVVGELP